jgi:two-component system OmpR family response regulator
LASDLPDGPGLPVLRHLRQFDPRLPALLLTAGAEDGVDGNSDPANPDKADWADWADRIAKPCHLEEVVLRLRALLGRAQPTDGPGSLVVVGDLALDEHSGAVTRAGHRIDLTGTEFELLRCLMHDAGRVVSKAQLLDQVWRQGRDNTGRDNTGNVNIVELYVSYLRKKIDAGRRPMIHTRRGVGYVLRPAR